MLIGGLQKLTLIDYPNQLAAIIFTRGCPMRCHFCHNASLVLPSLYGPLIDAKEILAFLEKRKDALDGLVISGGEPAQQKELISFCIKVKQMGYLIKLDTSGLFPNVIENLLEQKLVDYIAMDIKAPLPKYQEVVGVKVDEKQIKKSIQMLLSSQIGYEFRSTLVNELHSKEDVIEMAKTITGAPLYILQKYNNENPLNPFFKSKNSFTTSELTLLQQEAEKYVKVCQFR